MIFYFELFSSSPTIQSPKESESEIKRTLDKTLRTRAYVLKDLTHFILSVRAYQPYEACK